MSLALQYLMNGSVFRASYEIYTAAMGAWWIVMLHIFFIGIVGFESRSESVTAGYALIVTLLLKRYSHLPVWSDYIIYTIIVFSIAVLLYQIFRGDR